MTDEEIFEDRRPIANYEGYYSVTRDGRVWSEARIVEMSNGVSRPAGGRWLTPFDTGDGYFRVNLRTPGHIKQQCVHWLVARAFLVKLHKRMEVDHIDRNSKNNDVGNLRYVTRLKNTLNRKAKGYYFRPSRNRWQAILRVGGKSVYTGLFKTEKEAHEAYWSAKNQLLSEIP